MADRRFEQFTYGLIKKPVHLVGKAQYVAATDEWTILEAPGIASIEEDAQGEHSIILEDSYVSPVFAEISIQTPNAEDIQSQIASLAVDKVEFRTLTAGSEVDLPNGSIVFFHIILRNSTVR